MKQESETRRSFIIKAVGIIGTAALSKATNLFAETVSDTSKPASPNTPLTFLTEKQMKKISDPGDYEVFKLNKTKILFARISTTEIIALSAVCTHEGCTVKYKSKENDITCWCHGAKYDLKGNVVKGPAKNNLTFYPVTIKDGKAGVSI